MCFTTEWMCVYVFLLQGKRVRAGREFGVTGSGGDSGPRPLLLLLVVLVVAVAAAASSCERLHLLLLVSRASRATGEPKNSGESYERERERIRREVRLTASHSRSE